MSKLTQAINRVFLRHHPAMTLVEVEGLYDDGCLIEIEAVAVVG
jgi:enamine deaminase RidA (YjgF/YER057c/UK114 family)